MDMELHGRNVTGFSLNYRAHLAGAWREVVRYDTAHGRLHMHRFWEGPDPRPWPGPRGRPLDEALAWADQDLWRRWPEYRARREAAL